MTKIRNYIYSLLAVVIVASGLLIWGGVDLLIQRLVYDATGRIISIESSNSLQKSVRTIENEIKIAQKMSELPSVIRWSENPNSSDLAEEAIERLNEFRSNFASGSYFVALKRNQAYYQNDKTGTYNGSEKQIEFDRADESAAWFFSLVDKEWDVNLNVDYDRVQNIYMLWINVPIRNGDEILGITGTGFELSGFIESNILSGIEGIDTIFLDSDGSINLSKSLESIVRGSAGLTASEKTLIYQYLTDTNDQNKLKNAFSEARESPNQISITDVSWNGTEHYFGIVYIPVLDWFQVTLVNNSKLIPISYFDSIALSVVIILLLTFAAISYGLNRLIVTPLEALANSAQSFKNDRTPFTSTDSRVFEVDHLGKALVEMTESLRRNEEVLETRVEERSRELLKAERMAWVGGLAAGVAHEINSPLGYVISNIRTLRDYATESIVPELKRSVAMASETRDVGINHTDSELEFVANDIVPLLSETHEGSLRIQNIVRGLQKYTSLDQGVEQSTSLNDVAGMAVDLVKTNAELKGKLVLEMSEAMDSHPLMLEPTRMVDVVCSLISNGLDACEEKGGDFELRVATSLTESALVLTVRDNGVGMTEEVMAKLFVPFFTTKAAGRGVGLSLSIGQKIVSSYGGRITVRSQLGVGTEVSVEFPR